MKNWIEELKKGDVVTVKAENGVLSSAVIGLATDFVELKNGMTFWKEDGTETDEDSSGRIYPATDFTAVARAHSLVANMETAEAPLRPCKSEKDCQDRVSALVATFPSKKSFCDATGIPYTTLKNWLTQPGNKSYRCPPIWLPPILEKFIRATRDMAMKATLRKLIKS